jgi:hypothetical protein
MSIRDYEQTISYKTQAAFRDGLIPVSIGAMGTTALTLGEMFAASSLGHPLFALTAGLSALSWPVVGAIYGVGLVAGVASAVISHMHIGWLSAAGEVGGRRAAVYNASRDHDDSHDDGFLDYLMWNSLFNSSSSSSSSNSYSSSSSSDDDNAALKAFAVVAAGVATVAAIAGPPTAAIVNRVKLAMRRSEVDYGEARRPIAPPIKTVPRLQAG